MDILIDFDGTCVAHEFPKVGKDIGAVPVLNCRVQANSFIAIVREPKGLTMMRMVFLTA